jgi:hypothetical protein
MKPSSDFMLGQKILRQRIFDAGRLNTRVILLRVRLPELKGSGDQSDYKQPEFRMPSHCTTLC